jgi:hypothetical protein
LLQQGDGVTGEMLDHEIHRFVTHHDIEMCIDNIGGIGLGGFQGRLQNAPTLAFQLAQDI